MEMGKRIANEELETIPPSSPRKHSRGNGSAAPPSGINGVGADEESDAVTKLSTPAELSMAISDDADLPISCLHDVSFPEGYEVPKKDTSEPLLPKKPAREYPFTLDPFQREAIQCLEDGESVLEDNLEDVMPDLQSSGDNESSPQDRQIIASQPEDGFVKKVKERKTVIEEQASEMRERHSSVLRALQPSDFHKGYLQLLEQLTKVGNVSEEEFTSRLEQLQSSEDHYKIVVIEDIDRQLIVATGTVLIELKFLRSCGKVGHIEDIVVDQSTRGQHLGQRVVEYLTKVAKELGCYKVILDCSKENVPFYEKCGFYQKELQMAHYF